MSSTNPDRAHLEALEAENRRLREALEMIGGFYTTEETEQTPDPRATVLALDISISAARAALRGAQS